MSDAIATPPVENATPPANGTSGISEPWAKDWIKSDFTLEPKALERLPEHLKGMKETLGKYGKLEDVFTSYQSLQTMAGKKALAPLPADAPDHARAERKALLDLINGVPADVKAYGITRPDDLPEQHWNPKMAEGFATWAQKHSIAPSAVKELMGLNIGTIKEQLAGQQQAETQFWAGEQQAFDTIIKGENIPADRAAMLVEKGAIALGLDLNNENTKLLLKGKDARLMAMRHAIATGEDKAISGNGGGNGEGGSPQALADDARKNPANPLYPVYWNKEGKYSRTDQQAAVEKVNNWLRIAAEKNPPRGRTR